MSVVASVRCGSAMGFEFALSIPLLQRIGCPTYQLAELFRRISVVHTYILLRFNMFVNTV
jgi:hypothetical protein